MRARNATSGSVRAEPVDARDAAIRAVSMHAQRFPDLLVQSPATEGLEGRDAALAHAIHEAVVRRWLTLVYLITPHLRMPFKSLEPRMQAVLLCGAAQLVFLDRIPVHAAVNESVNWAKRHVRPGAGGMVNAVLRRVHESLGEVTTPWEDSPDQIYLDLERGRRLCGLTLPEDPVDRLGVQVSAPAGLLRRWVDAHGLSRAREGGLFLLSTPPTVLNVEFAQEPVEHVREHDQPGHAVFDGSHQQLGDFLAHRDDIWVQDAASGRAIRRVRSEVEPRLIVDLCAGKGTKTRQLARTFPSARIVATDVDEDRYRVLDSVFANSEQVVVVPAGEVLDQVKGQADLVLLDVPCSNSGVLSRRPEAKYRFSKAQMRRLTGIQKQILSDAMLALSSHGVVLYSTCSLELEEDAEPLSWACERFGTSLAWSELVWPSGLKIGESAWEVSRHYHDGAFCGLLRQARS